MPQIVEPKSTEDEPEAQRAIVRLALDEIATETNIAFRESGLSFPVGLAIPSSGYALITMITPIDPSEEDWAQATGWMTASLSTCFRSGAGLHHP